MRIIVISKTSFNREDLENVSNIAYSSGTYTITADGTTHTYIAANYMLMIIN